MEGINLAYDKQKENIYSAVCVLTMLGYQMYTHTHIHTQKIAHIDNEPFKVNLWPMVIQKKYSQVISCISLMCHAAWTLKYSFQMATPNPFQPATAQGIPGTGKQVKQWVLPHPESLVHGRLENDWSSCFTRWATQMLGCIDQDKWAPCYKGEHSEIQQSTKASKECFGKTEF